MHLRKTFRTGEPMYLSAPGAKTALINGQVVDPDKETVAAGGVLIEGAVISATGAEVTAANAGSDAEIIDCRGQTISPGLIDMRAFLGEPGAGHRETIATASAVWFVPRPRIAISAKAKMSDGIDWKMSVARITMRSHQPPR